MAERRMFAKTLIDSDMFLDMPSSTQCLYFHLSMRADDDGFINNPKKIQRVVGSSDDDLKLLIAKNFIIPFDSGVVVIKHWRIHNYIRSDRYKETLYLEEKSQLNIGENKEYILGIPNGIPVVDKRDTQSSLGKSRLGKVSLGQSTDEDKKMMIIVDNIKEYFNLNENDIKKVANAFLATGKGIDYLVEKLELTKNNDNINSPTAYLIASLNNHKSSIDKNGKNIPKKTGFHNFNETFDKYTDDELDEIIAKSQKQKFGS